jgi:hypothetical protein
MQWIQANVIQFRQVNSLNKGSSNDLILFIKNSSLDDEYYLGSCVFIMFLKSYIVFIASIKYLVEPLIQSLQRASRPREYAKYV